MLAPAETEWAYAAGFFDGEGCVAIAPRGRNYTLSITNTDEEIMKWLVDTFGGRYRIRYPNGEAGNRKVSFVWHPSGANMTWFAEGIRPYLRVKAERLDELILVRTEKGI